MSDKIKENLVKDVIFKRLNKLWLIIKGLFLLISAMYIVGFGFHIFPLLTEISDNYFDVIKVKEAINFFDEISIFIAKIGIQHLPLWGLIFVISIAIIILKKGIGNIKN